MIKIIKEMAIFTDILQFAITIDPSRLMVINYYQ